MSHWDIPVFTVREVHDLKKEKEKKAERYSRKSRRG